MPVGSDAAWSQDVAVLTVGTLVIKWRLKGREKRKRKRKREDEALVGPQGSTRSYTYMEPRYKCVIRSNLLNRRC